MLRAPIAYSKMIKINMGNFSAMVSTSHLFSTTIIISQNQQKLQSTVDFDDVARHTKQMETWWDPKGPMKLLHLLNHIRVPFVRDGLVQCDPDERTSTPLKGKKILDVGCGGGILSEALARLGAEVTGVDASHELIELAQSHCTKDPKLCDNKPTYFCTSIEDHAHKYENAYDGVVASEIIEHVENSHKELFVKSCVQTLKPGGRIFFTTPSKTRFAQLIIINMVEGLNIVPPGTHQYEKFMTSNELTFLVERSGCHVEMILGMFCNFLTNKWSFTKNQSFMFALQAVKK